jgi:type I restriction enzyme R subunit
MKIRDGLELYEIIVREIVESKRYADFATSPTYDDFNALTKDLRKLIPEYVKDYVPLNKFM